jgi:cobalamin biosynthesis protein CobT
MKSPRRIIIITMLAGGIVTGSLILRMEKQRPASGHGHHEDHQDHEADETHATHDEHEQNGTHEGHDEHHAQHNAADHIELTAAQLKLAGVEIAEALSAKLRLSLIL